MTGQPDCVPCGKYIGLDNRGQGVYCTNRYKITTLRRPIRLRSTAGEHFIDAKRTTARIRHRKALDRALDVFWRKGYEGALCRT